MRNDVWDGLKGADMDEINAIIGPSLGYSPRMESKPAAQDDPNKVYGKIVRYQHDRSYGYIKREDNGEDLFFHVSAFPEGAEIRTRQRVSFDVFQDDLRFGKTKAINARCVR